MRTAGKIIVVAGAAAVLAACTPNQGPSDLPPGTDPTPAQTQPAAEPAESSTPPKGRECTIEDFTVDGEPGAKPTVEVPKDCDAPKQALSKDIEPGTGPAAKAGDGVEANYALSTFSDGKQIQTSWDQSPAGEPLQVQKIGAGEVIQGWDEGLVGMKQGGRKLLVVPADKGYGPKGKGEIKPNETLVFVIDAVQVTPAG